MDKKTKIIIGCILILFFQLKVFPEFTLKILTEIDKYLSSTFGLKHGISSLVAGIISGLIFSYSSTYLSKIIADALLDFKYNANAKERVEYISLFYMQKIKNKFYATEKYLLVITGYFLFYSLFAIGNFTDTARLFIYSFCLFICFLFLTIKDFLIEYRIRKGLFGTNRTEARELIDFIIKNSKNFDFTDSNGNLRRALLPEAKDAVEGRIPGTLGGEACA